MTHYEQLLDRIEESFREWGKATDVNRHADRVTVFVDGSGYQVTARSLTVVGGVDRRDLVERRAKQTLEPLATDLGLNPEDASGRPRIATQQGVVPK